MNKERIRKLADVIEKLESSDKVPPRPHTDYTILDPSEQRLEDAQYFDMRRVSFACGSPACIAGWAAYLFADKQMGSTAQSLLEIDSIEAEQLFVPTNYNADYTAYPGEEGWISPHRAAKVLRNFADTGIVDWNYETA